MQLTDLILEHTRDIVLITDLEGRIVEVNPAALEAYGYSHAEMLAKRFDDLTDHDTQTVPSTTVHRRKDGSTFVVEITAHRTDYAGREAILHMIRDTAEGMCQFELQKSNRELELLNQELAVANEQLTVADEELRHQLDELQKSRVALESAHQQLLAIIEFLPDATFVIDRAKKVIAWNRAIEEMTGVGKEEMIGRGDFAYAVPFYGVPEPILIDLIGKEDREIEKKYEFVGRQGDTLFAEVFVPTIYDGKGAYVWAKASPLFNKNGQVVGAIESVRDITERKQMEEKLRYLSMHDALTGLYNRGYFQQEMRRLESGRHNPVGLIIGDLDGLKLINDTMGHETGDALLAVATGVIKSCFRDEDVVARIGGDEFAVLLPDSDQTAVESAVDRIREMVREYNRKHPEMPLTISVGYAVRTSIDVTMAELFNEADNNMYREKLHRSQSGSSSIISTLVKLLEERDFIADGHAERLKILVSRIAEFIGLSQNRILDLRLLAEFHDIGKVGISDQILFKPGPLTVDERTEVKRHCEIGYRIAQSTSELMPIADWILKHHEWWNGEGYPLGIEGEQIPLECRILAIADAYDVMTSNRPDHKAHSPSQAVAELKRCSGTQFDPNLVPIAVSILEELNA